VLAVVPPPVTVCVPSKVNLHLAVGDLRDDGYHELTTVFQALSLSDEVTVAASEEPGVEIYGEGEQKLPRGANNLAWRAVRELAAHVGRAKDESKVRVVINKGIPVSGGMAGGSADAAGALIGLAALWGLEIGRDELAEVAAKIGSDVPFALSGGTALGTGRGERLVPVLSRHTFHWVLAFDSRGLSTPRVYAELDRMRGSMRPVTPLQVGTAVVAAQRAGDPEAFRELFAAHAQLVYGYAVRATGDRTLAEDAVSLIEWQGRHVRLLRHELRAGPFADHPLRTLLVATTTVIFKPDIGARATRVRRPRHSRKTGRIIAVQCRSFRSNRGRISQYG
jgi:4-diphosphocytidyl-2C-methyl-D-erythritol kinase